MTKFLRLQELLLAREIWGVLCDSVSLGHGIYVRGQRVDKLLCWLVVRSSDGTAGPPQEGVEVSCEFLMITNEHEYSASTMLKPVEDF